MGCALMMVLYEVPCLSSQQYKRSLELIRISYNTAAAVKRVPLTAEIGCILNIAFLLSRFSLETCLQNIYLQ